MNHSSQLLDRVSSLSARDFENLVFDCMRAIGVNNLVWRTPGSDTGRDIEGIVTTRDISGYEDNQIWYIECKRYSKSIDWPTLWKKLSYADSMNADVFFLVTNSNPSPNCESQIVEWNKKKKRPSIRVWRGYDFPLFLRSNPTIGLSFGLFNDSHSGNIDYSRLANIILNLTQCSYSAYCFDQNGFFALEACSALTELLNHRLSDIRKFGKFVAGPKMILIPQYTWITVEFDNHEWEDVGFRALTSYLHHLTNCDRIHAKLQDDMACLSLSGERMITNIEDNLDLQEVLVWSRAELCSSITLSNTFIFSQRG